MSVVDGIETLCLDVGYDHTRYLDLSLGKWDAQDTTSYSVKNFAAIHVQNTLLSSMAMHPAFTSLSSLELGSTRPEGLMDLLSSPSIGSSLTTLDFVISEPFSYLSRSKYCNFRT